MKVRILVALILAMSFLACTLGPDYQRPEIAIPEAYRGVEISTEEASDLAEVAWWRLFGDPVLDALIESALEENRDLLIATARIEEARARFRVTHADRLPQVGLTAEALREKEVGDGPESTFNVSAVISWEADLWGRLRRADEAARARALMSVETRRGVVLSLVADVSRAYFELRNLDRRMAITLGTVATRRDALEIAQLRFEGGLTSQLEVRQAETELAGAEFLVPRLYQQQVEKENELCLLLGRSPGDVDRGVELEGLAVPPRVPVGLPSELLRRRPDIRASEQQLIAANAEVGIATAGLYPQLSLSGFGGTESNELDQLVSSGSGIWELVANLTAPLWQGGRLRADVEASKARFDQAALEYDHTILQAFREVADALSAVETARDGLAAQQRLELASRQYLELASLQYNNGVVAYLDVLDAQRQLFSSELELSNATRDRLLAVVQLYRALGGGWATVEEEQE